MGNICLIRPIRGSRELSEKPRGRRFIAEGALIVISILLAFGIEAWWAELAEAEDERESLELLVRDLSSAIEQLEEFSAFVEASSEAAFSVLESLAKPDEVDRTEVSELLMLVIDRRTVLLPRAAYTDLLSTGNLRVVRDRDVRDSIVRFYEAAARAELIIARNNAVFADDHLFGLVADGLVAHRPIRDPFLTNVQDAQAVVMSRLGPDFEYMSDFFWTLPPESQEWHALRGRLLSSTTSLLISRENAQQLAVEAAELRDALRASLDAR
jgi:hypothetical protein